MHSCIHSCFCRPSGTNQCWLITEVKAWWYQQSVTPIQQSISGWSAVSLRRVPPDVNDNVPFFTSSIYEASVTEGAEMGTLVFQVSANDLDLGLNGKVKKKKQLKREMLLFLIAQIRFWSSLSCCCVCIFFYISVVEFVTDFLRCTDLVLFAGGSQWGPPVLPYWSRAGIYLHAGCVWSRDQKLVPAGGSVSGRPGVRTARQAWTTQLW